MFKIKPLVWSEERIANEKIRYNHCITETPFGRIVITWKGWQDDFSSTIEVETIYGDYLVGFNTIEEAKAAAFIDLESKIRQMINIDDKSVSERPLKVMEKMVPYIEDMLDGIDKINHPDARNELNEILSEIKDLSELANEDNLPATKEWFEQNYKSDELRTKFIEVTVELCYDHILLIDFDGETRNEVILVKNGGLTRGEFKTIVEFLGVNNESIRKI